MKNLIILALGGCLASLSASGQYVFFEDDFESAEPAGPNIDPTPLIGNGMVVGANIFDPANEFIGNYFSFPAPNIEGDGARFSNIDVNEGGEGQGDQVLAVFSDYNNGEAHMAGQLVDANVFVEFIIEEADLGTTVTFVFDAKLGDFQAGPVEGTDPEFNAESEAFLKVLDPVNGFQPFPNLDVLDASVLPGTWGTYTLTIEIDESWLGNPLQAGFRTKTSNYAPSAMYYDNFSLTSDRMETVEPVPKIVSTSKVGEEFTVTFESLPGYEYTLLKGETIDGPYDFVDFLFEGDGTDQILFDLDAIEDKAFYRLEGLPIPE